MPVVNKACPELGRRACPELGRRIEGRRALAWLTLSLSLALALAACAAPQSGAPGPTAGESTPSRSEPSAQPIAAAPATAPPTVTAPKPRSKPAPPMSDPLPPERVPDTQPMPAGKPVQVVTRCKTDAECMIKDVGNCCGFYPACVNVDSPTDPKGVQAQCAKSGMASVCGFPAIEGCQCVKGQCTASTAGAVAQ